jgi:hypothetical protein
LTRRGSAVSITATKSLLLQRLRGSDKPSDSNRRPPPYHGGFGLRLGDLGKPFGGALSPQLGWFLGDEAPFLEDP